MIKLSLTNFINFGNLKPYEKPDFLSTQAKVTETFIVEDAISKLGNVQDKSHTYFSIGKIFENSNDLELAQMFYELNFQYLIKTGATQNKMQDAQQDISRIQHKLDLKI